MLYTALQVTDADAICMPRVIKMTFRTELLCPSNVFRQLWSLTDHSLTVPSPELVATHWNRCDKDASISPSLSHFTWSTGENFALHTPLLCPDIDPNKFPSDTRQSYTTNQRERSIQLFWYLGSLVLWCTYKQFVIWRNIQSIDILVIDKLRGIPHLVYNYVTSTL